MNGQTNRKPLRSLARRSLLAISCTLVLLCGGLGCSSIPPQPAPITQELVSPDWLVSRAAWFWVIDHREDYAAGEEVFFADPPTDPILLELQQRCQELGYDFPDLRQCVWDRVQRVEHLGE